MKRLSPAAPSAAHLTPLQRRRLAGSASGTCSSGGDDSDRIDPVGEDVLADPTEYYKLYGWCEERRTWYGVVCLLASFLISDKIARPRLERTACDSMFCMSHGRHGRRVRPLPIGPLAPIAKPSEKLRAGLARSAWSVEKSEGFDWGGTVWLHSHAATHHHTVTAVRCLKAWSIRGGGIW